ncbi:MAG: hypothetical protein WCC64_22765 [Aliidongia sp.]
MSDLRKQAKAFYNSLDFKKPINFGDTRLFANGVEEKFYVERLHGRDHDDPVQELADQIDFSDSAGAYLFTGNRGTGKTTELLRLAKILQGEQYNCEVFYIDIAEYLYMSAPVEVSDFLIAVMGALSEKFHERFKENPIKEGYFERVVNLLQTTTVTVPEAKLPIGPVDFKIAFQQNPTFKQNLQENMRGVVEKLVQQAHGFARELKSIVAGQKVDSNRKVVLIVDSFERLRGNYDNEKKVFASVETLFSSQAENLRLPGISTVYTVPAYVTGLAGGIGAYYAGGRIYALPSAHIYQCCPAAGALPAPSVEGIAKMTAIVQRRYPDWNTFFTQEQLDRLAQSSGGDLRDYFRMLRLALVDARSHEGASIPEAVIENAEDAVRADMVPIAGDDRKWLAKIMASHRHEMAERGELADFARLQQGKYVLQYRNGEDWYDVHPLLRAEVTADGAR